MSADALDQLRAANPVPGDDLRPDLALTLARIAQDDAAGRAGSPVSAPSVPHVRPGFRWLRPARLVPLGAVAAAAFAASLAVTGPGGEERPSGPFAPLQMAAAVAAEDPSDGRFEGYTQEDRSSFGLPGERPMDLTSRKEVRPLSSDEFEVTTTYSGPIPRVPKGLEVPKGSQEAIKTTATTTTRDAGGQRTTTTRWHQAYGTLELGGAPMVGQPPTKLPTDPAAVRRELDAWAKAQPPADGDPELAALLTDAYGDEPQDGASLAVGYAHLVLTAPRIDPAVRAAIFDGLAFVPGVRVEDGVRDPLGRPAAAIVTVTHPDEETTTHRLYIEPSTARVLAEDWRSALDPGANDAVGRNDVPHSEGSLSSVYRYDD